MDDEVDKRGILLHRGTYRYLPYFGESKGDTRLSYYEFVNVNDIAISFDEYLDLYKDEDEAILRGIYIELGCRGYEQVDKLYHKLYGDRVEVKCDHPNHIKTLLDVVTRSPSLIPDISPEDLEKILTNYITEYLSYKKEKKENERKRKLEELLEGCVKYKEKPMPDTKVKDKAVKQSIKCGLFQRLFGTKKEETK